MVQAGPEQTYFDFSLLGLAINLLLFSAQCCRVIRTFSSSRGAVVAPFSSNRTVLLFHCLSRIKQNDSRG